MNYRNATYNARGTIDCEIEHPEYGWVPFTASPDDVEPLGKDIFDKAKLGAGPYVAPPVNLDALAAEARVERSALLAASDWTQTPDAPVDQQAWAAYRQDLRDITEQGGFPEVIVWPEEP